MSKRLYVTYVERTKVKGHIVNLFGGVVFKADKLPLELTRVMDLQNKLREIAGHKDIAILGWNEVL